MEGVSMVINTNVSASNSALLLGQSSSALSKSLARLSSGSKITSPADDSAGLAVSMKLGAQISRNNATLNNVGNATSFSQTQDGYLQKIGDALNRMSELTVAAQDVTKTIGDRTIYNQEFQALATYINDAVTKDFNGVSLFSGNALNVTTDSEGGTFQMTGISGNYIAGATQPGTPVPRPGSTTMSQLIPGFNAGAFGTDGNAFWGVSSSDSIATLATRLVWSLTYMSAGSAAYDTQTGQLSVTVNAGHQLEQFVDVGNTWPGTEDILAGLGMHYVDNSSGGTPVTQTVTFTTPGSPTTTSALDISSVSGAKSALTTIKNSINQLASDRAAVGSNLTRLNYTSDQLGTLQNNLAAAKSRITDVDVAQESTNYARQNILVQSGTAMLAQANAMPQSVLKLLG